MLALMLILPLALVALVASDSSDDGGTNSGDDFVEGDQFETETDRIDTGAGNDTVFAGFGEDLVFTGEGDDRAFGEEGTDFLFGGAGDDFLRGGSEDDILFSGGGEDTLFGDVGDDVLQTTDSFDDAALDGNVNDPDAIEAVLTNPDLSFETGEADEANGGVGNDLLLFGGNDTVSGGPGDDLFATGIWVEPGNPATITDFEADEIIAFETDAATAPTVQFEEDTDGNVVLTAGGEVVVNLPGVTIADLSEDNLTVVVS